MSSAPAFHCEIIGLLVLLAMRKVLEKSLGVEMSEIKFLELILDLNEFEVRTPDLSTNYTN